LLKSSWIKNQITQTLLNLVSSQVYLFIKVVENFVKCEAKNFSIAVVAIVKFFNEAIVKIIKIWYKKLCLT